MKIENLSYKYDKSNETILDDITLDFARDRINVILGVNGSGKSTLFDLITGVLESDQGFIEKVPRNEICYQLQGFGFPTIFKGKDIIRLIINTDIKKKFSKYNEILSLPMPQREKDKLNRLWNLRVGDMSLGERRWLIISTMCMLNRKLYVFDEPMAGLDPDSRKNVLNKINTLRNGKNIILLSTHILHDLENIKCKIFFLEKGKLLFEGDYNSFLNQNNVQNPDEAFQKIIRKGGEMI